MLLEGLLDLEMPFRGHIPGRLKNVAGNGLLLSLELVVKYDSLRVLRLTSTLVTSDKLRHPQGLDDLTTLSLHELAPCGC